MGEKVLTAVPVRKVSFLLQTLWCSTAAGQCERWEMCRRKLRKGETCKPKKNRSVHANEEAEG